MKTTTILLLMLMCNALCFGQHRKHVLGFTFLTSPPWYSCVYCNKEISPNEFLPEAYDTMKIPMNIKGLRHLFVNGYYRFVDSLEKKGIKDYEYFMGKWNEKDTSCISSEIALHKSEKIGDTWLKTHKAGMYYLDKRTAMHTNGAIYYFDKKGKFTMLHGGRFSDAHLLADKWYKIIYDKPKKKK